MLLAIAVWLLYQIKHSYDKKTEYARTDDKKLSKGDGDVFLGRKGKAGSENVIIIDMHEGNFDESIETKEARGGQADAVDWQTEEKVGGDALSNDHEESQEGITNSSNTESQQEKQGNEDVNADSDINGGDEATNNGLSEGIEEVLRLPSQRDSDNSLDQNENRNGVDDSLEQNELPKDIHIVRNFTLDGAKSDDGEATSSNKETIMSSTNPTEIGENTIQVSEPGETGKDLSDNALAGTAGSSSSLPEDQSNMEISNNDEVHERETVESQGADSGAEITGNNTIEDSTTDARSDDESLPSEQNNAASTNPETFERDMVESQRDNTAEAETTENHSMVTANTDARSEEELANPSISIEGNNVVMPDSNEASKREAFESQVDNASGSNTSEEEKTDIKSGDELAKLSLADEQNNMQTNNEGSKREELESSGDNASDAEITAKNASGEEKTDPTSTDELANLSVANNVDKIAKPDDTEDAKAEAIESQGGNASEAEKTDNSLAEAKTETTSEDDVANSSQSDEQNNSQIPVNKTSYVEAVESQGDGASEAQSTSDTVLKDADIHPDSIETSSESGSNGTTDAGQEGGTDSESSSSVVAQQEELTDPKAAQ